MFTLLQAFGSSSTKNGLILTKLKKKRTVHRKNNIKLLIVLGLPLPVLSVTLCFISVLAVQMDIHGTYFITN